MRGRMERVKAALRAAPELCSLDDFYNSALSNGRNDISTLKERGWIIDSCWVRHGEGEAHCHYWLVTDPEQMRLAGIA